MKEIFTIFLTLVSGATYTKLIPNITNPEQVIWKDINHVIFVKDENIFEYDIWRDDMSKVGERRENDFVGLGEDGNLVLCEIEHFIINSKDEFSTVFKVGEKELKFFPTIQPISLRGDVIIAKTALDFLEQHFYKISISTGEILEIEEPKQVKNGSMYLEKDEYGNVYLNYNTGEIFKLFVSKGINRVKL